MLPVELKHQLLGHRNASYKVRRQHLQGNAIPSPITGHNRKTHTCCGQRAIKGIPHIADNSPIICHIKQIVTNRMTIGTNIQIHEYHLAQLTAHQGQNPPCAAMQPAKNTYFQAFRS